MSRSGSLWFENQIILIKFLNQILHNLLLFTYLWPRSRELFHHKIKHKNLAKYFTTTVNLKQWLGKKNWLQWDHCHRQYLYMGHKKLINNTATGTTTTAEKLTELFRLCLYRGRLGSLASFWLGGHLDMIHSVWGQVCQAEFCDRRVDTQADILAEMWVIVIKFVTVDGICFLGRIPHNIDLIGRNGVSMKVERLIRHYKRFKHT